MNSEAFFRLVERMIIEGWMKCLEELLAKDFVGRLTKRI